MGSPALLLLLVLGPNPADLPRKLASDAGSAGPEASHDAYAQPPSLGASALCDELRQNAQSRGSERAHLDEERRQVKAERERLEKLAQEIEASRQALRSETAHLEELLGKVAEKPASALLAGSAPSGQATDSRATAVDKARVDALAKTVKGMKPEQAAAVISRLEPALSAELLHRLRPADAGAVLDHLKPEQAAELVATMARPGGKP